MLSGATVGEFAARIQILRQRGSLNTNRQKIIQLKLRDLLANIRSLQSKMTMCTIFTSNVSCDSGEMVGGATGGEFSSYYAMFHII